MGPEDLPSCPFCNYINRDHYFLLQHVETVHPEGTSPFNVRDNAGQQIMAPNESEGSRESSPEYIECQCGEFCILAEFESHLEMHYAEGAGFDERRTPSPDLIAPKSKLHHSKASSTTMETSAPLTLQSVVSNSSRNASSKYTARHRSRNTSQKSQNPVMGFIDVLRHSAAPPPRKLAQTSRPKGPQRLGVSTPNQTRHSPC